MLFDGDAWEGAMQGDFEKLSSGTNIYRYTDHIIKRVNSSGFRSDELTKRLINITIRSCRGKSVASVGFESSLLFLL